MGPIPVEGYFNVTFVGAPIQFFYKHTILAMLTLMPTQYSHIYLQPPSLFA